jgi:hypothetical protein
LNCLYDIFKGYLRLYKITISAQAVGAGFILCLSKGCQHNDADITQPFGIAQYVQHFKAANAWHHNIRNDKVGTFFLGNY